MSKKHFIAFAREISKEADPAIRRKMAEMVCQVAAADNQRFDRDRFMAAANIIDTE